MVDHQDFYSGKYTGEEIQRILSMNARPTYLFKPFKAYYKKTATEHAPSWREKREVRNSVLFKGNCYYIYDEECFSSEIVFFNAM